MSTYAIGDLQGCLAPFDALLARIGFNPDRDRLLLAGDLVNRGPDSLGALRRVHELRDNAQVVLGNHDLHLLAVAHGHARLKNKDTLQPILDAPDRDTLPRRPASPEVTCPSTHRRAGRGEQEHRRHLTEHGYRQADEQPAHASRHGAEQCQNGTAL